MNCSRPPVRLLLAGFGFSLLVCFSLALAQDWNQWRGAARSGISENSPTLASSWPEAGPRKLWTSETIPSDEMGGFGSLSLCGGRGFVYVNWKERTPIETRKLGEEQLRGLGWSAEKMPDELAKAMEDARTSEERKQLKGEQLKPWLDKWVEEHLKDKDQKKFTNTVRDRLTRGAAAWPLDVLAKLTPLKDKEFANDKELEKALTEQGLEDPYKSAALKAAPKTKDVSQDVIFGLDAATGKTLWKKSYPGIATRWGSSSTPLATSERVYAAGAKTVYCLAASDGKEIWKADAVGTSDISSSPALVDGVVVILAGHLLGLDAASGKTLWEQKKLTGNNPSPTVWTTPTKTYLICNSGGSAACVEPKTGEILWTVPGGGGSFTAAIGENALVLFNQELVAYKLTPDKPQETPAKLWSQPWKDRGTTPIIYQGHVYGIGSNKAFCVRLRDGEVRWQEKFNCEIASPVLADGKLLGYVEAGRTLLMIKADPEKFDLLVKSKALKMASCSSPVLDNGRLYLREANTVSCYDLVNPGDEKK